jgi:hypothetical protein
VSKELNRSWQEIAAEAYREQDPDRRRRLGEELERCLEERAKKLPARQIVDRLDKASKLGS